MISISSRMFAGLVLLSVLSSASAAETPLDLGKVTEKHVMIPMRDGKHLSAYLYFPEGQGPWQNACGAKVDGDTLRQFDFLHRVQPPFQLLDESGDREGRLVESC